MAHTYRVKALIEEKYGTNKYTTGCTLVAQWLNFWMTEIDPVVKHTAETVATIADQQDNEVKHSLILPEAEALVQLFSLPDITYLFHSISSEECKFLIETHQSFINHK